MSGMTGGGEGSNPSPDPTVATNDAVERAVRAERDYVDGRLAEIAERLRGIDTATKLLNETVNRVPTDVTKEVTHLRELMEGQFGSVSLQFKERDTRSEREARDNSTKVDAAFAAQKEASAKQDESNAKAIDKSERSTAETIKTNQELSQAKTDALTKTLDEVKLQVSRIEATKVGYTEQRTESHASIAQIATIIGAVGALLGVIIVLSNVLTGQ